jgi:hypothetical protein
MNPYGILDVSGPHHFSINLGCCLCHASLDGNDPSWGAMIVCSSPTDAQRLIELFAGKAAHSDHLNMDEYITLAFHKNAPELLRKPCVVIANCDSHYGPFAKLVIDIEDLANGEELCLPEHIALARQSVVSQAARRSFFFQRN